jgi:uncharacterized ferritin-like protein (DUF455 family)
LEWCDVELRDWALTIIENESPAVKFADLTFADLTDRRPGAPLRPELPARPAELVFERTPRIRAPRMPKPEGFHQPRLRALAHHIMANHELQALETMAFALLAWPDADPKHRMMIAEVMLEEQRHAKMHVARLEALGSKFGAHPVNGHVWIKTREFRDLADYWACVPLVFEAANLDHSLSYAEAFRRAGDDRGASVMRRIHRDEIKHVAYGVRGLAETKAPDESMWSAFCSRLHAPTKPVHAKGEPFQVEARREAGLDDDFIDQVRRSARTTTR